MKKITFVILAGLLFAFNVCAADFSPTVLTVSGYPNLHYEFDGAQLNVPVTVTGTPASVWLVINTKDKDSMISNVRNGHLGWHYVNKIDTSIYISQRYEMLQGINSISWDGRDENGNIYRNFNLTYYLWAYDSTTPSQKACNFISTGFGSESQFVQLIEKAQDGQPLATPILFGSQDWLLSQSNPKAADYFYKAHGTVFRWALRSDPEDVSLLQTTRCPDYGDTDTNITYGGPVLEPNNFNYFYHSAVKESEEYGHLDTIQKWEFVPGGTAKRDKEWGGWENVSMIDDGYIDIWSQKPSCYTDQNYIYTVSPGVNQKEKEWNKLRIYDFDGNVIMDKMMHEWYMPNDKNPHGFINASFEKIYSRTPYNWLLIGHYSCFHEMINTTRILVDEVDETDMVMWQNSNGDYFLDSAYSPFYEPQWYCLSDDMSNTARPSSVSIDRNGFNIIGVSYFGLASFAVSTQDGSGIGYMQFANDRPGTDKFPKLGGVICDTGSAYDGLYFANVDINDTWVPVEKTANLQNRKVLSSQNVYTSYVAFDSFRGVISCYCKPNNEENQTSLSEDGKPEQFSVSQNSPNPFNPSTSIDIVVPSRNIVKAEIYNIYGSKVSVLADGVFEPGKHTLKWNASGLSAGVYFCRVNYGDKSRTIRMTLVK